MPRIRQSVTIEAPRWKVFHALIDAPNTEQVDRRPTRPCHATRRTGATATAGSTTYGAARSRAAPRKILEMVENSKLVTDWPDWRGDASRPAQRVNWVLEAIGEPTTRVTLIHEPFERTTDLSDYPQGWAHFLSRLKQQVESPRLTPRAAETRRRRLHRLSCLPACARSRIFRHAARRGGDIRWQSVSGSCR